LYDDERFLVLPSVLVILMHFGVTGTIWAGDLVGCIYAGQTKSIHVISYHIREGGQSMIYVWYICVSSRIVSIFLAKSVWAKAYILGWIWIQMGIKIYSCLLSSEHCAVNSKIREWYRWNSKWCVPVQLSLDDCVPLMLCIRTGTRGFQTQWSMCTHRPSWPGDQALRWSNPGAPKADYWELHL